jgi:hypothetical protein
MALTREHRARARSVLRCVYIYDDDHDRGASRVTDCGTRASSSRDIDIDIDIDIERALFRGKRRINAARDRDHR